jgi:uncharacterized membrane protein YraQ (UPF0718 family)
MDILKELLLNFIDLANTMSIYILFGLIFAGILKEILPNDFISKHLGKNSFGSVIKATILGIPMPVCSCSVIPLAKSLQKEGASNGAVQSFLISTPITGVDSILATYSFFGLFFTIYRVFTSIIIAITTGLLQNIFQKNSKNRLNIKPTKFTSIPNKIKFTADKINHCNLGTIEKKRAFSIKRVFVYAFNTLFGDISKSLFIGLIIGSLFSTFLPKELISSLGDNLIITYILVLIISMPLYVCATSSLPIGASLLISGLPIGAVYLFLSAGPATNSVTMSVINNMFGKKGFFIYIGTISILSIIFGYILDNYFNNIEISRFIEANQHFTILNYIATTIMIILMLYYWRKK